MSISESKQTKKWGNAKLLKFAAFTILIILLLLEISFRIVFYIQNKNLHNSVSIQGSPLQIPDDSLIFKNSPFYLDYNNRFQNNEEGMRSQPGDEFIPQKTSNDFWVLLTGASAIEGMGSNRNGNWLEITGVDDHPYNKCISFYLEKKLQAQMPDKKVKVFNAAFSASCLYQSYMRYIQLEKKIQPDWVISMDGQNDPGTLAAGESSIDYIKNEWKKNPQFHYPLKAIIAITSHSAFFNFLKQKLFHFKEGIRMNKMLKQDFPLRKKWADSNVVSIQPFIANENVIRAVDSFSYWLLKYDAALTSAHRKHLLLLQPHMAFRDTSNLSLTEKAANHYYRATFQDNNKQAFLNEIYKRFSTDTLHHDIVPMLSVHHWPGWVFVDYCHFSDEATGKIAAEMAQYILSDGKTTIFKN